jgi:ABC-type Zn uptake system ZnuABC Zn-binding protein ZnuA
MIIKENMSDSEKITLLLDSLEEWDDKFKQDINKAREMNNRDIIIQKNAMSYMSRWIINSIKGGLDRKHNTNICNIILKADDVNYDEE